MDISVQKKVLKCKIVNSKNEYVPYSERGIGIANVKKRLEFIYPGNHELKLIDEGSFYVVALLVNVSCKTERSDLHLPEPHISQAGQRIKPIPAYK